MANCYDLRGLNLGRSLKKYHCQVLSILSSNIYPMLFRSYNKKKTDHRIIFGKVMLEDNYPFNLRLFLDDIKETGEYKVRPTAMIMRLLLLLMENWWPLDQCQCLSRWRIS